MNLAEVPVAVLAGGLATRLGALTAAHPKALISIAERPFVEHQLELLRRRGIRRVVFLVGHLGEPIIDHVGDGHRFGVHVEYVFDGPQLLGTGGALRGAHRLLQPLCWVLYGDSYLDFDYGAALAQFIQRGESGMMTVFRNEGRWDRSNVAVREGRVSCYDKRNPQPDMDFIDYGASLLRAEAVERIPPGEVYDLANLLHDLAERGALAAYEVEQRFFEVGSLEGIQDLERHLASRSVVLQ